MSGPIIIILVLTLYWLSSGAAFVSVYLWPEIAPTKFYALFYSPLDRLAKRSPPYARFYNSFHNLCYKKFVKKTSGK